jgi:hypothetical protein
MIGELSLAKKSLIIFLSMMKDEISSQGQREYLSLYGNDFHIRAMIVLEIKS